MPATVPALMAPPAFGPFFFLGMGATMVGGCASFGTFIAGLVLLILVRGALVSAARQAEMPASAGEQTGPSASA
jgi:hypothetical protein